MPDSNDKSKIISTLLLSRRGVGREVRLGHSFELAPVQFPGGSEWHSIEDDYFLGRLVADPSAGELDQLLAGRTLRAFGKRDIRADVLTVDKIVDPDHTGARDARVREHGVLDLLGANVGAVVHDDLLPAPAEKEVAVLVDSHHIA